MKSKSAEATFDFESLLKVIRALAMTAQQPTSKNEPCRDLDLVKRVLAGDGDSFGTLIKLHQQAIGTQMRRFSSDFSVIEELVHEVFVEAYQSLKSYRGNAPMLHWLRKIAVRVGYRFWKRNKKVEKTFSLTDFEEQVQSITENGTDRSTASEAIDGLLQHLKPPDRLILTLIYWDGCTVAEAAVLSGWSVAKVKVRTHRARKRLRDLIEKAKP